MKKYMENKKVSPYIWAVGLGKIPSSSHYPWASWEGREVVRNFQI